jgi:hypothetical protein
MALRELQCNGTAVKWFGDWGKSRGVICGVRLGRDEVATELQPIAEKKIKESELQAL